MDRIWPIYLVSICEICYLVGQVLISIEVTRASLNYKEFSLIPKQENSKKKNDIVNELQK